MPLYNQQTNLQGQGRFSPGVTYYAGIRAPAQPVPTFPKSESSFNIDLSRIGDAMIAAKESETKLGMAAINMEHDLQQAEKDRELKMDLAKMQQEGEDRRLDKRLGMEWQIANLKNDTELQKLAAKKKESIKDQTKALANLALASDKELREWYVDWSNGNMDQLEWESRLNNKITNLATQTGANIQDLYTAAGSMGYKVGMGSVAQGVVDTQKTLREQQLTQDISIGGILLPQATESEKATAGAQFREDTQNVINMNRILSDPNSTQMEKDMAKRILAKNQDKLIDTVMLRSMTDVNNNMRSSANPVEFLEASKDYIAQDISANTGSDYGQLRRRTDAIFKMYGVDKTLSDITSWAENNSKYSKYAYDTYMSQYKMGEIKNSPMLRAAVAFGPEFIRGLSPELQEAVYGTMAYSLIGTVQPNYQWTDSKGNDHKGWKWNSINYPAQTFEDNYIAQVADEMGLTPEGAVYWLSSKAIKETPQALYSDRMMPEDGVNVTRKALMNTTGNPNEDLSYVGLTAEQASAIENNVVTCVDSGNCTPQQIHNISESLPEPQRSLVKNYEDIISASYKLGKYIGGTEESAKFHEMANYLNPDNINLEVIKNIVGSKVNPGDKNRLQLKNTVQYYTIKDGRVYIDYTQQGLLKTGTEDLAKAATYVRHTLERAGLTEEEQVAWYKLSYPNMIYTTQVNKSILTDAFSYLQDATIGAGTKADTQLASWLDKKNKEFLEGKQYVSLQSEEDRKQMEAAFNMLKKDETTEKTTEANAKNMLTNEATYVESAEGWEDKETDGINYSRLVKDGVLHIQIGNDSFSLYYPLDKSEEELVSDLKNNPRETITSLNGSWSRKQ